MEFRLVLLLLLLVVDVVLLYFNHPPPLLALGAQGLQQHEKREPRKDDEYMKGRKEEGKGKELQMVGEGAKDVRFTSR